MPTSIYRGGVQNTTATTQEAKTDVANLLPGTIVKLDPTTKKWVVATAANAQDDVLYVVGEPLYGTVNDAHKAGDSVRSYALESGHLYSVRAAAGVSLEIDASFSIAAGLADTQSVTPAENTTRLTIDIVPNSTLSNQLGQLSTASQLIPVKFI